MIDVNELRIGNYLLLRGKVVPVGGIPNHICLLIPGEQYAVDLEEFNFIPISEEILLKCGFVYNSVDDCFDRLNLRVRMLGNSICAFIGFEVGLGKEWHDANIELKSLHKLQNLYFSLIGEELNVVFLKSGNKKNNAKSLKELIAQTDNPLRDSARDLIYSALQKAAEKSNIDEALF